jgi:transcriptional regulator with XRE-family HTH domain
MDARDLLAATVRTARGRKDLSQQALAELVGCDTTTIGNIENAKVLPTLANLIALVRVLDLDGGGVLEMLARPEGGNPKRVALEARLMQTVKRLDLRHLEALAEQAEVLGRLAARETR